MIAWPGSADIRVKFVAKGNRTIHAPVWRRQLPSGDSRWGRCQFSFDPEERDYDWLVVYDDLPAAQGERFSKRIEQLACPREHTLFITAEPSSIKVYGTDFLSQFGVLLSSQESWATPHANVIQRQPALRWYYGVPWKWVDCPERLITWDEMSAEAPTDKTHGISTVTSSKQMSHTLHRNRFEFVTRLREALPELAAFGHGVQLVDDKAEALDSYRYHVAIENHICDHHITEKLTDAFLGCALPFYSGAPNASAYFPKDSFIPIDITDFDSALSTIRQAMAENAFEARLPAILEARRRVLEEENLFAVIERIVTARHDASRCVDMGESIISRRAMRGSSLRHGLHFLLEKRRIKRRLKSGKQA